MSKKGQIIDRSTFESMITMGENFEPVGSGAGVYDKDLDDIFNEDVIDALLDEERLPEAGFYVVTWMPDATDSNVHATIQAWDKVGN